MKTPNIIISAMTAMLGALGQSRSAAVPTQVYVKSQSTEYDAPIFRAAISRIGKDAPFTSQRKIRTRRRRLHAAGYKNAFSR